MCARLAREDWIDELIDETLSGGGPASLLIRELVNTSDSDIAFHLGAHFLPEDADAGEFLSDDDDDDDDQGAEVIARPEVPDDYPVAVLTTEDTWARDLTTYAYGITDARARSGQSMISMDLRTAWECFRKHGEIRDYNGRPLDQETTA